MKGEDHGLEDRKAARDDTSDSRWYQSAEPQAGGGRGPKTRNMSHSPGTFPMATSEHFDQMSKQAGLPLPRKSAAPIAPLFDLRLKDG